MNSNTVMEKWKILLTVKMFLAFAKEESKSGTQCQEDVFCTLRKFFVLANRAVFLGRHFPKLFPIPMFHKLLQLFLFNKLLTQTFPFRKLWLKQNMIIFVAKPLGELI